MDPTQFTAYDIKEVISINHDTKLIRVALPNPNLPLSLPITSCLLVGSPNDSIVRPYTPTATQPGYFDLIVKKYPAGPVSSYIHSLNAKDKILIKGPFSKWIYTPGAMSKFGMIAAGTGITPMIQLINEIFSSPPADINSIPEISLVYSNKREEDILLRDKLDALSKKYPNNFKVFYTLTQEKPPGWLGGTGRVTKEIIKDKVLAMNPEMVFVCGPDEFLVSVSGPKGPNKTQGTIGGFLKELNFPMVYKF